MKTQLIRMATAALALTIALPAHALTYFGSRSVGTANVSFSITTNGAIGSLQNFNITDWSVSIVDGASSALLEGPGGINNSIAFESGPGLTATATDLFFNFDANIATLGFASTSPGSFDRYCLTGTNSNCNGFGSLLLPSGREMTRLTGLGQNIFARGGNQLIASVANPCGRIGCDPPPAVPEPASWALMIAGFGLTGAAIRRRTVPRITYA